MRIGVDVDGVLYHWSKTARYLLREVLPNSPYTKDGPMGQESTHWNYIADNIDREHWEWLWKEGPAAGMFRGGHLVHGAVQGMKRLAEAGHKLVAITSRPEAAVTDTMAWLSFHQFELHGVHIIGNSTLKSSVTPHCDAYVDDKWENCLDLATNTGARLVALFDQPWNQDIRKEAWELKSIARVKGWKKFTERIERL